MTVPIGKQAHTLLEAPLQIPDPVRTLGRSLWLYVHLAASANSLGHICKTVERLARDLSVTASDIERWLERLDRAKLVTIAAPPPFLVVKLPFWSSGDASANLETPAAASEFALSHREVPVSSSKQAAASILEDGGLGEGDPLVQETLRVLGESDAREIAELESRFPRRIIQEALVRVTATPPEQIRKSKLALFRYLLAKLLRESHDHHQTHHA